jgi:hypothetical protein
MYYVNFPIANIVKWSHRNLDSLNCQTMKVKPYIILNTSRKHVNYEEDKNKVPMNKPYNNQNTNICNAIFRISFFKALLQWYFPYWVWNSSHSQFCRSTSCYLVKHNLVMAPKASLTYLPTTQAWMPLASALPESGSFRPVSRFSPIPVCPGSFRLHLLIVL